MDVLGLFNALDLLLIGTMAASLVVSVVRGGVREVASIVALVAGFYLAARFYPLGTEFLFRITSHKEVNDTISFLVIFLFVGALASYAGGQLTELIKKAKLWGWNLTFGFILGVLRGVLAACFIVYALLVMLPHDSGTFTNSKLFPYAVLATEKLAPVGPKTFREDFRKKLDAYRKSAAKKPGSAVKPETKPDAPEDVKKSAAPADEKKPEGGMEVKKEGAVGKGDAAAPEETPAEKK